MPHGTNNHYKYSLQLCRWEIFKRGAKRETEMGIRDGPGWPATKGFGNNKEESNAPEMFDMKL